MNKYMLLFMGLEYKPDGLSSEDYAKAWQDWISELGKEDLVLSSLPFEWSGKLVIGDKVTDLNLKEVDIGGYMLIKAENMEEAVEVAKEAPHMKFGGTTVVRKCLEE